MTRILFVALIARPFFWLLTAFHVRGAPLLPKTGPAIIIANHNSHFDAFALTAMFPLATLRRIHVVAATDYFARSRIMSWLAANVLGMIGLNRSDNRKGWNFLALCSEALANDAILIVFPEGTRGEPDRLSPFSRGIAHLAKKFPEVPFVPVRLSGFGQVLPRGAVIPLPYCCEAHVGEPLFWSGSMDGFMRAAERALADEGRAQTNMAAIPDAAPSFLCDPATAFAAR